VAGRRPASRRAQRHHPNGLGISGAFVLAWGHAGCLGRLWEWRMRPSGLVAVVVPSGWRVIFQPQRWMAMRWWYRQYRLRLARLVGPLWAQGIRWWISHTEGGWSRYCIVICDTWNRIAGWSRWRYAKRTALVKAQKWRLPY